MPLARDLLAIGFTGTRHGMSELQKQIVLDLLVKYAPREFHHGDCVGADVEASQLSYAAGCLIVCHPPIDESLRAFAAAHRVYPALSYFARNRNIVDWTGRMIACPYDRSGKGGTWYTINYARKKQKPLDIVYPDGSIE
jgi:hypothetical protein